MKKLIFLMLTAVISLFLCSCSQNGTAKSGVEASGFSQSISRTDTSETAVQGESQKGSGSIVIYFSCTGTTENAANKIAELSNSDIYKIIPAVPYTSEDLNYGNDNCRANVEQHDPSARPEISGQLPDLSGYDRVYIGFPVWWGTCPKIINTFLETCDLSGKTVYPFCTSGGSGISTAQDYIESVCANADVKPGIRANGASDTALSEWIAG